MQCIAESLDFSFFFSDFSVGTVLKYQQNEQRVQRAPRFSLPLQTQRPSPKLHIGYTNEFTRECHYYQNPQCTLGFTLGITGSFRYVFSASHACIKPLNLISRTTRKEGGKEGGNEGKEGRHLSTRCHMHGLVPHPVFCVSISPSCTNPGNHLLTVLPFVTMWTCSLKPLRTGFFHSVSTSSHGLQLICCQC